MPRTLTTFAAATATTLLIVIAQFAAPAARADDKATIAIPVNSISFAPVYIAEDMGLWKKAGIKVTVKLVRGIAATNAVIAKSLEFSNGSGATVLRGQRRGRKIVAIMTTVTRPTFELVMRKDVVAKLGVAASAPVAAKAKALKGLRIGLSGLNNITHTFLTYVLAKGGLKQTDIKLVGMAPPSMYAALKRGDIDGFETSVPWTLIPVNAGAAVNWISGLRGDMPELSDFANTVVIAREGYCEANPTICRKVVKGYQSALRVIHRQPDVALGVLQKRFKKMKPALVRSAFEKMVKVATSQSDGRFPKNGLAGVQEFMIKAGHMKEKDKFTSFAGMYTEKYLSDLPTN